MSKPIKLKTKAEIEAEKIAEAREEHVVWVCTHCSCITWELLQNSHIKCAHCGVISPPEAAWFDMTTRGAPEIAPDITNHVTNFNNGKDFAKRRSLDEIKNRDIVAMIYIDRGGFIGTWGEDGNELSDEQKEWLGRKLVIGMNKLMGQ